MSRVHYSFDSSVAALAEKPEPRVRRTARSELSNRRRMRNAMETFGLFAFGFGATNLLIHFAVGFVCAARMSSMLHPFYL